MSERLLIAVASDLHAYDEHDGDAAPSHLRITDPENQPGKHPISGLLKLISEDSTIRADLLLCPGDLGHKAKPAPLKYAWQALQTLKEALGAGKLIATAGNHDLDSRYKYNSYDAKGALQSLAPSFPLLDETQNDRYWSRNFVAFTEEYYNFVVLNSSAYHGTAPDEFKHGRIAESTVSALRKHLETIPPRPINILLCHHHPQIHMELSLGEYDAMSNGQLLLDLLGSGDFGRWLVIHGHKHHPKITYASGSATSPVIFSAGSLSAALYLELAATVRNQFYLVSVSLTQPHGFAGTIRSWDWTPGIGWGTAGKGSGLPAVCGFGHRGDPAALAAKIHDLLPSEKVQWGRLKELAPEIDYVMPQDFLTLKAELAKLGLLVQDVNGLPHEIGKRYE
jgi:predicted MPP superfamily phosphohydrolase